jgi:hypothetical protein
MLQVLGYIICVFRDKRTVYCLKMHCLFMSPHSPNPQGILLVYDITNGWSFDGIDRWIREIDEVS